LEKLDMRNLSRVLIATAFSTLAFSTLTPTTWADDGDAVKSSRPPYKPGREINDDGATDSSSAAQATAASDDGSQPVKSSRPPYKPGREADDGQDAGKASN
jgi:hypothetical protein